MYCSAIIILELLNWLQEAILNPSHSYQGQYNIHTLYAASHSFVATFWLQKWARINVETAVIIQNYNN